MASTVLEVKNISKKYVNKTAVNQISFRVEKGQIFGILGPNGSGKTTTLSMILDIIRPSSGEYSWFEKGSHWQARKKVGALLDTPNFFPWTTVEEQLNYWSLVKGATKDSQNIQEVLNLTGLTKVSQQPMKSLSLGMKQRYGLACSLLNDPEVLILDEPTISIDAKGIAEIRQLILDLADRGKTIIIASHILDEIEKICSHLIILKDGEVLEQGAISDVLQLDNTIEIGAPDLDPILKALSEFKGCQDIVKARGSLVAKINTDISIEKINEYLASKGLYVSHLEQKRKNLENHFLKLLDQ